jgi:hypothetical protein
MRLEQINGKMIDVSVSVGHSQNGCYAIPVITKTANAAPHEQDNFLSDGIPLDYFVGSIVSTPEIRARLYEDAALIMATATVPVAVGLKRYQGEIVTAIDACREVIDVYNASAALGRSLAPGYLQQGVHDHLVRLEERMMDAFRAVPEIIPDKPWGVSDYSALRDSAPHSTLHRIIFDDTQHGEFERPSPLVSNRFDGLFFPTGAEIEKARRALKEEFLDLLLDWRSDCMP